MIPTNNGVSKKEILKLKKLRRKKSMSDAIHNRPLFCQLNELHITPKNDIIWRESARWLKFVEVVEGNGRWSKPHVSTIPLHNLVELRSLIANGLVILDYKAENQHKMIEDLIKKLSLENMLSDENKDNLREILHLPHSHQYEKEFVDMLDHGQKLKFNFKPKKKSNSESDSNEVNKDELANVEESDNFDANKLCNESGKSTDDDESISIDLESVDDFNPTSKRNTHFLKKIPHGCKTANVLIGEVDFLKPNQQITVLIRLSTPVILKFTEIVLPSKFIFIHLGEKGNMIRHREIGKCISTLFSDELFQNDVIDANDKQDILIALDDFLDQTTIVPPGQWDTTIRLAPPTKIPSREERLILKLLKVKKDKPHEGISGGHEDDPCLKRTGKICGGLIQDVKRKLPYYLSDFKDAFNFQCIPAIAFLYFACLSPIITFGGLLGYATDKNMGAIESLLSGLITGVTYSLFAGQPMTIMGSTGPVLVFETILNTFSKAYGIDYIGFRCYVGLWCSLFLMIIVITDLSFLVKYITRFTEELFAILIALIFVNESIDKLFKIKKTHHYSTNPFLYKNYFNDNSTECFRCVHVESVQNESYSMLSNSTIYSERECESLGHDYVFLRKCGHVPDVFFFSVILYMSTFLMAIALRYIKFTRFFPTIVRSKISDFGVLITIVTMVSIDHMIGLDTPKLHVPSEFHPTIPNRGWFINPIERNKDKWWLVFGAIPPAMLVTILVFMDQHITAVIVNRKGNKLKKSAGYHLDLLICALCIGINSLFGLPWFVAATVLSMNHIIALRKISTSTLPGEATKLVGVIEQRVTGVIIFVLIGCSIFVTDILTLIPMPVLYSIFMYMGVTPMGELEFFQRMLLMLMPKKHQPNLTYLRHVRLYRVNVFTAIQLICLAVLFFLKLNKTISITFPLMVLALIFIRIAMSYVFTEKELSYLDDLIPGMGVTKRKRQLSINQVNVEVFDKARKDPSENYLKERISEQLNTTIVGNNITEKGHMKDRRDKKTVQLLTGINQPLINNDEDAITEKPPKN